MGIKSKISKEKRNNQKRNKSLKQGGTKGKQKHPKKVKSKVKPDVNPPQNSYSEDDNSSGNEDALAMVDEDDITFLKNAVLNKSYGLLNSIRYKSGSNSKNQGLKRKHVDEELEENYENEIDADNFQLKELLPIKSHGKIIPQVRIEEKQETDTEENEEYNQDENAFSDDEGSLILEDTQEETPDVVSTAKLLASHVETLNKKKIQIGSLCAGVLENPEEKIDNLRTVLKILDERQSEAYLSVKKIAIISLQEVFKDILPSFQITHQEDTGVKLKKDTLKLQKYETTLLNIYKKFLKKLEKLMSKLVKKKGNTEKISVDNEKLGVLSLQAMCDLLITQPYFNFSENIVQAVIPFFMNRNKSIRVIISSTCCTIFKEDKKGEITLKILRVVNQLLKKHSHNVNTEMLEIFLSLRIKEVNLDAEKEQEIKQKKILSHRKRVLQLSKKEKKRKKQLNELEKELLETKAEENKQIKQQNLTEITKVVFGVCFRIIKSSKNTKMLGISMEILSKFAHCINLDFYVDLVNTLNNLLKEDWLSYTECLRCIKTVFSILSGQGEAINLDPSFLYVTLYRDLLTIHASKTHQNFELALETLTQGLVKRRKKITNNRLIGFTKRLSTLSLQLLHNGTLSCLAMIRSLIQQNHFLDVLLDLDPTLGDGKYQPELEDAEYCNASTTALYETVLLNRHYHPVVKKYSLSLAHGAPSTGEKSVPIEFSKFTPEELYTKFDMSEMAFNPAVPPPKKLTKTHLKKGYKISFVSSEFKKFCIEKSKLKSDCGGIFVK